MKKIIKWIAIILSGLIGILFLVFLGLFMKGNASLQKTYNIPADNIAIPTDPTNIDNGKHRVETMCVSCHGGDLSGKIAWFNAGPLGTVDSANLTSGAGGVGRDFTDQDFVRAIRFGVDPQGKPIFMPAVTAFQHLSDADLGAIIAYIKTIPPVDHQTHGIQFSPLGKIMLAVGQIGSLPAETVAQTAHVTAPPAGANSQYGQYLVDIIGCRECHGAQLTGGKFPDPNVTLAVPNITPGSDLKTWTEQDFVMAMRTGVTPDNDHLNPAMPWHEIGRLTDDELKAIWLYLQSLPVQQVITSN
jgi:mono/diheme cytochrome c family protein